MNVSPIQSQNQNPNFGQMKILLPAEKLEKLSTQRLETIDKIKRELAPITDFHFIIDAKGQPALSMPNGKLYRFKLFEFDPGKHFTECEQNGGFIVDKDFICLRKSFEELMEPICLDEKKVAKEWNKIFDLFKTGSEESYFDFLKTTVCEAFSEFVKLLDRNYKKANSYQELTKRRKLLRSVRDVLETPPQADPNGPGVARTEKEWAEFFIKMDKELGHN